MLRTKNMNMTMLKILSRTPGLLTGFGCSDPPFAAALGGAAALAPPPDLGSPLALSNTAFSQHSWICQLLKKSN